MGKFKLKRKPLSKRQLIVGIVVTVLFILFAVWAGLGWFILLPFVVDYYFFDTLNWGWYRNVKNKVLRTTLSWVMDILFAVVAVVFFSAYFFQNFAIPSSSLEKTLLVGDYLFVNKLSYGPRVPMTPVAVPLAHNTFLGAKSYCDKPQWEYRRLKGFGSVKRNDLVVFNFPAGDTVPLKMVNPDYYTLKELYGRETIWNNPERFGKVVYRPVDRRDHYVKRCVGMPGDTLSIKDNVLIINGEAQPFPKKAQHNYYLLISKPGLSEADFEKLDISSDDRQMAIVTAETANLLPELGFSIPENPEELILYHLPLTEEMRQQLSGDSRVGKMVIEQAVPNGLLYPVEVHNGWTRDNYGPLVIPKKGMSISLDSSNIDLYRRCITAFEGHTLELVNASGKVLLDGKPATHYTFAMDYYFMLGDNRHNSADSRFWGFVPEDHVVGKPGLLWLSLNKDKSLFGGKIRFGRMFRLIKG